MSGREADISVIVPSHERTQLALDTVRSILDQTMPVREVIIVANGDEHHARFLEEHSPEGVRVIREAVPGQQAARNAGIHAATSKWVAFLDDDDLYLPRFVESVLPAIRDGRAEIISTDHRKFRPDGFDRITNFEAAPIGYWKGIKPAGAAANWNFVGKFPLQLLLKRIPVYPSTTVIRRDFALEIGGFDRRMYGIRSEDIEFLVRALTYGNLALVWKPLVHYRLHVGNLTRDPSERLIGKWRVLEFIRENHPHLPEDFRRALDRYLPKRRREIAKLALKIGDLETLEQVRADLSILPRAPDLHRRFARRLVQRLRQGRQKGSAPLL